MKAVLKPNIYYLVRIFDIADQLYKETNNASITEIKDRSIIILECLLDKKLIMF